MRGIKRLCWRAGCGRWSPRASRSASWSAIGSPVPVRRDGRSGTPWRRACRALAVVLSMAVGACAPSDSSDFRDAEIHPNAENAVPSNATLIGEDSVPADLAPDALDAWRSAKDHILAAQTVMRLGTEEEGPQLFGRIGDVAVDSEGNIFVFDALAMELRVFDSTGQHISSVGGFGDGPLDLRYNLFGAFELLSGGDVLVANGALTKLFRNAGELWELVRMIDAAGLVNDLCVIGARAFFAGWRADDNTLVQTASVATGSADAGLVPGYQHPDYLVKSKMAEGARIACFTTAQHVIVGWGYLPMIQSYRFGQPSPIWTSKVAGRLPSRIVYGMATDPTGTEAPAIEDQTDPRDFLTSLLSASSDHLLIQYSRASRSEPAPPVIRTYLVDIATGIGALLGTDLPVMSAVLSDGYVAVFDDPYPRIEIRKVPGGDDR